MILWLLNSWISYIVHAALIAGVIGTFFGSIVARIPVINSYGAIVKTIALPLLIVAIFAEGYLFASKSWIEETKKFEEKVKIAEQKAKHANDNGHFFSNVIKAEIASSVMCFRHQLRISTSAHGLYTAHDKSYNNG